jgi:hypothetical protein
MRTTTIGRRAGRAKAAASKCARSIEFSDNDLYSNPHPPSHPHPFIPNPHLRIHHPEIIFLPTKLLLQTRIEMEKLKARGGTRAPSVPVSTRPPAAATNPVAALASSAGSGGDAAFADRASQCCVQVSEFIDRQMLQEPNHTLHPAP